MKIFKNNYPQINLGLLLMRIGIGIMFVGHGYPKLAGGPEGWTGLGGVMANWGITFAPAFWGFMGGFTEFMGGILIILGIFFRPACIFLFITMLVATTSHVAQGDSFSTYSHAVELAIVFFSLYFTGPGRYSLDYNFGQYRKKRD